MEKTNNNKINQVKKLPVIGWREWVNLPELGIDMIKAKIDTGARTSALHAFSIKPFVENGIDRVRFLIHPLQHNKENIISCVADVFDKRIVADSGGHREERYVIRTPIAIANTLFSVEITLTCRDSMLFRMLLGRTAMKHRFLVNPGKSFLTTRMDEK